MTLQCPKCGQAPTKTRPFVEGFCTTCYFDQHPLITLRRTPQAKICSRCHAYYLGRQWVHQGHQSEEAHLYDLVCGLLDPLFSPSQPATFDVQVPELPVEPLAKAKEIQAQITATAKEYPYEEQQVLSIPITSTLCIQCKQTAGGYFEATLQIRSATGKLTPEHGDQIAEYLSNRLTNSELPPSALKFSETRGGFDVKCISSRFCRSLAKGLSEQFGLTLRVSSKVAGRTREGKTLHRDTYSLRFPLYQVGDVISYKQGPYMITGLRNGKYILTNLESEQRQTLSPKDLSEIDAELLNDEVHTFQVISVEGDMVQLMSQEDYSIYDLPRPTQKLVIGTMISVLEWKNRLILLAEKK